MRARRSLETELLTAHYPMAFADPNARRASDLESAAVLLVAQRSAYIVVDTERAKSVVVSWPDHERGHEISPDTFDDGSWALCAERCPPGLGGHYLIYWAHPFSPRIDCWVLNKDGKRVRGWELQGDDRTGFLAARKHDHIQYWVRLLQIAIDDDLPTLESLLAELREAAAWENLEVAYFCCKHRHLFEADVVDASRRVLKAFITTTASMAEGNPAAMARRVVAALDILPGTDTTSPGELPENARGVIAAIANTRVPMVRTGLPRTRAPSGAEARVLRACGGSSFMFHVLLHDRSLPEFVVEKNPSTRLVYAILYLNFFLRTYVASPLQRQKIEELFGFDGKTELNVLVHSSDRPPGHRDPAWAFQRSKGDEHVTLIPDLYYFWSWGYKDLRRRMRESASPRRLRAKKFFWRGSTTGGSQPLDLQNIEQLPRVRMCEIASALGPHADSAITKVVQARSENEKQKIEGWLKQRRISAGFVPKETMAQYQFLFEIDGNANSWGFLEKLLMGACVLKIESRWEQWFYPGLQPGEHYVAVAGDLSDLAQQIEWCLANEVQCERIAANGQAFANSLQFDLEMQRLASRLFEVPAFQRRNAQ